MDQITPVRCRRCRRKYLPETPAEAAAEIGPVCGGRRRRKPRLPNWQQHGQDLLDLLRQPMDVQQLLAEVDKIPGDEGWWHPDNGETYRQLATQLAQHMPADDVLGILTSAFAAAADEFGG